jgi:hypothetical protein
VPIQDLNAIGSDLAHAESEPFGGPFSIPTRYAGSITPPHHHSARPDSRTRTRTTTRTIALLPRETNWAPSGTTVSSQRKILGLLLCLKIAIALRFEITVWPEETEQRECQDHAGERNGPLSRRFSRLSFCSHITLPNRLRATLVYFSLLAGREAVTPNQAQRPLYEISNFNGGSSR